MQDFFFTGMLPQTFISLFNPHNIIKFCPQNHLSYPVKLKKMLLCEIHTHELTCRANLNEEVCQFNLSGMILHHSFYEVVYLYIFISGLFQTFAILKVLDRLLFIFWCSHAMHHHLNHMRSSYCVGQQFTYHPAGGVSYTKTFSSVQTYGIFALSFVVYCYWWL